ncbi:MAG: hypothetical protein HW405_209 [Candidatus Berkelbacteria bacterium]|nr:hypothetical protein [Candidatus Berkelbacteria bacterium]
MVKQILISSLLPTDSGSMANCRGTIVTDKGRVEFNVMMQDNAVITPAEIPQDLIVTLDASLEFEDADTNESGPCVVLPRLGKLYLRLLDPSIPRVEGRLILTCSDGADFDLCCEAGNVCCTPEGYYGEEQAQICQTLTDLLAENNNALPIYVSNPEPIGA